MHNARGELLRILLLKLSEKGRRSLRCSLTKHLNGTFRPILASLRLPNPHSECCPYPFSDSLEGVFLRSSQARRSGKLVQTISDGDRASREPAARIRHCLRRLPTSCSAPVWYLRNPSRSSASPSRRPGCSRGAPRGCGEALALRTRSVRPLGPPPWRTHDPSRGA